MFILNLGRLVEQNFVSKTKGRCRTGALRGGLPQGAAAHGLFLAPGEQGCEAQGPCADGGVTALAEGKGSLGSS